MLFCNNVQTNHPFLSMVYDPQIYILQVSIIPLHFMNTASEHNTSTRTVDSLCSFMSCQPVQFNKLHVLLGANHRPSFYGSVLSRPVLYCLVLAASCCVSYTSLQQTTAVLQLTLGLGPCAVKVMGQGMTETGILTSQTFQGAMTPMNIF